MIYFSTVYLPWLLSAVTIYGTIIAGNKSKWTWIVGIINQLLWLIWIYASGTWGMLPMTVVLCILFIRNHFKWMEEGKF